MRTAVPTIAPPVPSRSIEQIEEERRSRRHPDAQMAYPAYPMHGSYTSDTGTRPDHDVHRAMTTLECSPLQQAFFSHANMERLQQHIRLSVWEKSGRRHVIGRQSEDELRVVMRGVYLMHARHQPDHIETQVLELNRRCVAEVLPGILSGISLYLRYLDDIDQPLQPLAHPEHVSRAGRRQLEWRG